MATNVICPVLHLINGQHYSGAERVQDLLAQSLPEFGYRVEFALLKEGMFADHRRSTTPLHRFLMRGRLDWSVVGRIAEHVRRSSYRLLHAHTPRSLLVAAGVAKRTGLPLVYHVHSPVGRDSTRWLQNKINLWTERYALRRVTRLIAVSDNIGQYMAGLGYGSDRLTVVPNGVPVVSDGADEVAEVGVDFRPTWRWTLGTVALFRPRKGTEVLLEAVARLVAGGVDVGLLAVGGFETPDYEAALRRRADELNIADRVHWTGFTRHVNAFFPRMDLFVLPSLFGEGLPMVVLEAMATGRPIVATRVEGIEQALRDEIDGRIVEPGDAVALAAGVAELLQDPVRLVDMGQSARVRQAERFSERSMGHGTAAVYDQILSGHRGP